ncbi:carbohydrate-binding family 9-like protein [Sphingobacterium rhinopitheci]|uniref:carbohydrate-binding family 9-like protein n=1 Tax=Sphingobacterium rhinopitheci TaxID=2781960 RepID=UPI001F527BAE|nr:carbohydrate-binding family 9-like protein [Sphingobacterium rhinopitheci]MCI0922142.1 hypothetical protein [Sphingobacterium rhinopitheci]
MAKTLVIQKVANQDLSLEYDVLKNTFKDVDVNNIDQCPWEDKFPYAPNATFKIVHSDTYIGINYVIAEEFVKAQAIRSNENVWEDSCVEFFVSFDNKKTYYNFEFNVLGTGLIGYGSSVKSERNRLSAEKIDTIDTITQVVKRDGTKEWEIYLIIPKGLFSVNDFTGKVFHGNFYKCGDGLPNPHFIAWNNIDHPSPNFHLPQFFGELVFE